MPDYLEEATHLEVAADNEQVDAIPATDLARLGDGRIYGVERAMALQKMSAIRGVKKEDSVSHTQPSTAIRTPCDSKVLSDISYTLLCFVRVA
jgi:hypothetical protein